MALHSPMASDRSLALTIAAALVAVATASAKAQEPLRSTPPPHPFGQVRIGTVAFTPTINLTNVGIDTNVFDFSGTERRSPDFTMTLEPGVETRMTTRKLDARVSTTVGLVYYHKYASERAVNPRVVTTIDQRMNGSLSFYQELTDFSLQLPGNAVLFAVLAAVAMHRPPRHERPALIN